MVKGVNSNIETQYTLEAMEIKEGSIEASIFKEIDLSDGKEDGFLIEKQHNEYQKRTFSEVASFFLGLLSAQKALRDMCFGKQKEKAQTSDEANQAYKMQSEQNSVVLCSSEGLKKIKNN